MSRSRCVIITHYIIRRAKSKSRLYTRTSVTLRLTGIEPVTFGSLSDVRRGRGSGIFMISVVLMSCLSFESCTL